MKQLDKDVRVFITVSKQITKILEYQVFLETQLQYRLFPYGQRDRHVEVVDTDILPESVVLNKQSKAQPRPCMHMGSLLYLPRLSDHAGLSAHPHSY